MTSNIAPVSQSDLTQRRRRLRQRRRVRVLQSSWRILAVTALAAGAVWLATRPDWVLRRPEQVTIQGNQFIPADKVRSLIPISYPQSLLWVKPQAIAQTLKAKAPIAEVAVSRRLFPPGLTVQVKERYPVALALPVPTAAIMPRHTNPQPVSMRAGLLDESGMWIPLENYMAVDRSLKLPALRVIGKQETYQPYWSTLYRQVSRSPVKVAEINLQNPANLILKTELGTVHFGPYSAQFPAQLSALDRMRQLPARIKPTQIAFIDLRNLDSPAVLMVSPVAPAAARDGDDDP